MNNKLDVHNDGTANEREFLQVVLPSELEEIKNRHFIDNQGAEVERSEYDCVHLDSFLQPAEERSSVLNNVINDLYDEKNNDAWDSWHKNLKQTDEANDPIRKGLIGLAFSGGGIRSATFNLGILQALNSIGLFKCVDYLSTVSGGGYIGSCISSLYASLDKKNKDNSDNKNDNDDHFFPFEHTQGKRESVVFRYLRNHANFLAPSGFIDALRIPAVLVRGLVINFLVLLPFLLIAAVITVWLMPTAAHVFEPSQIPLWTDVSIDRSFMVTKILLVCFLVILLLLPLFFIAFRGKNEAKSSWKLRDRVGRFMGIYIVSIAAFAFIELQPMAIGFIHILSEIGWDSVNLSLFSGTSGAILSMFANHLLPKISKLTGALAIYFVGFFGFLTFWLIYLTLCDKAIDWNNVGGVSNHSSQAILQYGLLALVIIAAGYQWLKRNVSMINNKFSYRLIWSLIISGIGVLIYHYFYQSIPIDQLATVNLKAEHISLLEKYRLVAFVLWIYAMSCIDVNFTSIHRFYRDRLSKAYIIGHKNHPFGDHQHEEVEHTDEVKLSQLNSRKSPYHLINTLLNLQKTQESHRNGRHGDFFIFSKKYIGGEITGYCETKNMEAISRHVNLATAMAISGAAAAPNAGKVTIKPLVFIMAMLNIRLNYWLPNPAKIKDGKSNLYDSAFNRVGPAYLIRELLGKPDEKHNFINLSDGGHIENLGIYELLRRQCRLIIAGDGEADGGLSFQGLAELVRMVQIDMGVKIEIDGLDEIRRGEQHHAVGTIFYSHKRIGKLIYLKSSLLGDNNLKATLDDKQYKSSHYRDDNLMYDDNVYIAYYKNKNPDFPHQSTADQFFDEAQFECYRALGYQVAMTTLTS